MVKEAVKMMMVVVVQVMAIGSLAVGLRERNGLRWSLLTSAAAEQPPPTVPTPLSAQPRHPQSPPDSLSETLLLNANKYVKDTN